MKIQNSKRIIQRETHLLDATGQSLGRLASKIAILLRGKHKSSFAPHKDVGDFVTVENIEKMIFSGKKMEQKTYYKHSGYPGGLKAWKLKEVFGKNPGAVLRKAVAGMLPKNKLRSQQIKRLVIR